MYTTQGTIEQIVKKGERTALKIGEAWYSAFKPLEVHQGQQVEIQYETKEKNGRTFYNIQDLKVLDGSEETAAGGDSPEQRRILKSVALKSAVALATATPEDATPEVVVAYADYLYRWLASPQGEPGKDEDE